MKISKKYMYILLFLGALGIIMVFTPVGRKVKGRISSLLTGYKLDNSLGEQLPSEGYDWKLVDRQGKPFDFDSVKDEVVLINFWASWCQPCVQEMPSLQKLYDEYGQKVRFLFIAQDEKIKVDAFMTKKQYSFPVYYSILKKPELFISNVIPATYILDKSGKIVLATTGSKDWHDQGTRSLLDALLQKG
ncbi:MAG: TlpA family protein disulfide reductase [Maribacter sp.]|nr:TlpA family protein disulfide reductase [Maribacter sp.]